jgi:lipoprotein-anchoring transpeptidase ErfK/SrfK
MNARSLTGRIFTVVAATLLFLVSATAAWAVVNDYQVRNVVPKGVTIAGQDLGGMSEAQARKTIESAVSAPMLRPVTVNGDKKSWTLDPKDFVSIDEEAMLDDAYSTLRAATLLSRVNSQVRGIPLAHDVKPVYSVDASAIATWIGQTAKEVDRRPVDAKRTIKKYAFKIKPEVYGARLSQRVSVLAISQALSPETALSNSSRTVTLAVVPVKPKIVKSSFKGAIIVSLSQCKIRLYKGAKLVKAYSCAPGRPGFPTPTGDFFIQSKQLNAPWINPGTPWAASMPRIIPGGPGNPMGDAKIGINYPGVFMHGVPPSEYGSIGTHASHGCMRMMPHDVHDLIKRVHIGDPVFIRP